MVVMLDMSANKELDSIGYKFSANMVALKTNITTLDLFVKFIENNFQGDAIDKYVDATKEYIKEINVIYDELMIENECITKLFSAYEKLDKDFFDTISSVNM